jgi:hypothetical protein
MNEMTSLTLTFTTAQAQVVLNALASRPYGEVSGLIQEVLGQIQAQTQQPQEESK